MCPDIETFAPLIAASFGLDTGTLDAGSSAEHPGHRLRVRLADRSLRRVNPLLSVLDRLLDLADSRLPTSALLDLAATPPVTRRFGFTEDDLGRMTALIRASGVRWGFDAEHRGGYGLAGFGQNTWSAGLDRLLLGVTMDAEGERFLGTALPLDEVDSSDVDLLGRAAELVSRVRAFCAEVTGPAGPVVRSVNWWVETCRDALSALTAVSEADSWQSGHAYSELSRLADRGGAAAEAELSLADLRALLGDAFAGRATRANFRTGTLTMCTMLPMRSVPHRAICLLGVDEGVFPRHGVLDGDDILAREPWVGDRDPRSEDRQLLLDAVMAAQERLIVVYAGRDPRTGAAKPPAVPIGELLDALDETARTADGTPVRERITVQHPLQPFDARNFRAAGDRASDSRCFASFDPAALRGARAADSHRSQPPVIFETTPLPPLPPADPLPLAELIRFFAHPTRALLRARGHLFAEGDDEEVGDQIPIAPDGLQTWEMGQRMLNRHLQGIPLEQLEQAEWRRGQVPPPPWAQPHCVR